MTATEPRSIPAPTRVERGPVAVLVLSNLLAGIGVASGFAVGGLLIESVGGTALAGLGQACSVLGAAVAAVPLAALAARRGRRVALALGYLIACAGAALIVLAAVTSQVLLMLAGLGLFGVAQAVNLQSRYAATDHAPPAVRGTVMSIVLWATTVGSAAGPNLAPLGAAAGSRLRLPELSGPYVFSLVAFALAAAALTVAYRSRAHGTAHVHHGGAIAALRWAFAHPRARFAVVLICTAHAVMVMIMVMTPVHLAHHGSHLGIVGLIISMHVVGMYALSPLFGWLADRWDAARLATCGIALQLCAAVLGFLAARLDGSVALTAAALVILGLGWSVSVISASTILAKVGADEHRLPLQGATDAGMNYAGAVAAAVAGPLLAGGGFLLVNTVAAALLVPAVLCAVPAVRRVRAG